MAWSLNLSLGSLSASGGGIATCAARIGSVLYQLLYLKSLASIFFYEFDICFAQVRKCLAIYDDLYAVAGIDLVIIADLVIQ